MKYGGPHVEAKPKTKAHTKPSMMAVANFI